MEICVPPHISKASSDKEQLINSIIEFIRKIGLIELIQCYFVLIYIRLLYLFVNEYISQLSY